MKNEVELTDDELALFVTSLEMSLKSYEKYVDEHGKDDLDDLTKETLKEMKSLFDRLKEEYF